jgi:hypothetical protein
MNHSLHLHCNSPAYHKSLQQCTYYPKLAAVAWDAWCLLQQEYAAGSNGYVWLSRLLWQAWTTTREMLLLLRLWLSINAHEGHSQLPDSPDPGRM